MKFNGLVLYSPTPEEAQLLRDILDIHLKTKPDMKEISKRNSKKKFFSTKYNFEDIDREVQNLSLGGIGKPINSVSKKEGFMLTRRSG